MKQEPFTLCVRVLSLCLTIKNLLPNMREGYRNLLFLIIIKRIILPAEYVCLTCIWTVLYKACLIKISFHMRTYIAFLGSL
jgi:hypothetical protein